MIMLAALTEISTPDIKDMVYQQIHTVNTLDAAEAHRIYKEVREKIISWVSNRVAANAAQMDIGNIQCQPCQPNHVEYNHDEAHDVDLLRGSATHLPR